MAVHYIDMTPTWDAAVRIYLEVLRVNDWWSEPSKNAREEIQKLAQAYDNARVWIKEKKEENND